LAREWLVSFVTSSINEIAEQKQHVNASTAFFREGEDLENLF
jgi:hypothetical protein